MSPIGIEDQARDEEVWAIIDCNTSTFAQDIMNRRIKRVSKEIQESWSDRDRTKRAQHQAPIAWSLPVTSEPFRNGNPLKGPPNGNNE